MELPILSKRRQAEDCPPVEEIETEGQRQLKVLLENQLRKDVTLEQQLSQRRQFTSASSHQSEVNTLSGLSSLQDFQNVEEKDTYIAELKHCGLSEDEIELKLQYDNTTQPQEKKRRFGPDPDGINKRLEEIERKIQEKQKFLMKKDSFHGQKTLTRHEMELEKSLLRNSHNDGLQRVSSLLTSMPNSREVTHPDNPMDHLPEILQSLTQKNKTSRKEKLIKIRDKEKVEEKGLSSLQESENFEICDKYGEAMDEACKSCEQIQKSSSKYTSEVKIQVNSSTESQNKSKAESKLRDSSGYIQLEGDIKHIEEAEIISNRLTLEEIKQIPRFENYSEGEPNNVLYLKNLSPKVTQEDLVSLFIRFQKRGGSNILFRLLRGKMKGQAFVTFQDTPTTAEALHLVNGFQLKGKPVIIQYGKKSTGDS